MYGTSLTKTIGWVWLSNRVRKQTEALGKKEREKKEMATKFNTLFRSKDTQEGTFRDSLTSDLTILFPCSPGLGEGKYQGYIRAGR